jgi:hypothetical protein
MTIQDETADLENELVSTCTETIHSVLVGHSPQILVVTYQNSVPDEQPPEPGQ